ncbi:fatty acyl-CoA reductase wat-like isoform X2 [Diaphorina citri]|uniref:Fatty acyl-CoA reductase n=1 Tax=Diaphorina citri TaxID=121845 RepID=A0A3Q0J8Q0_DIACI|nr:fatty acyl-CoA reductase wat-like isoform X1 [Diaphorina citri]XP_026683333.1 fatty acyl-CoA reductase wat-like isoform X2 [Diaphorina citri]
MRKRCPHYLSKMVAVTGDCLKPGVGINSEDRQTLVDNIHVVFHCAATVRFDAHLKVAVSINLRATKALLEMAKEMKQLKSFVHVSTAYSNCRQPIIEERFYEPPVNPNHLIQITELLNDDMIDKITPGIVDYWPNTYALTKQVAEDMVRRGGAGMPVAMVRPSIVIATNKEPIPGWINNHYGPTGIVAGAGLGLLRSMHADPELVADMVPADNVINCIISAAWNVHQTWNEKKAAGKLVADSLDKNYPDDTDIEIYNYVSSTQKPIKWKEFMALNEKAVPEIPSTFAIWAYCFTLNKYKSIHKLYILFLHLLPALIVDTAAKLMGRQPKLLDAYQKIHKFSEVISFFSTQQFTFTNFNTQRLYTKMTEEDRALFNFDMSQLDWEKYMFWHIRGIRAYLVKDPLSTVPDGIRLRRRLLIAHYLLIAALSVLFFFLSVRILTLIFF